MDFSLLFPASGQNFAFDVMSIIALAIIAIVLIINVFKGFFKTLISIALSALVIFLAVQFASQMGEFLCTTFNWTVSDATRDFFTAKLGDYKDTIINIENAQTVLHGAMEQLSLPSQVGDILLFGINSLGVITSEGSTLLSVLIAASTMLVTNAIGFSAIFVVGTILSLIISLLLGKLIKKLKLGGLDKLLGGIFGLVLGIVIAAAVCYGFGFITEFMPEDFSQYMNPDPNTYTIAKGLYNFAASVVAAFVKI